MDTKSLLQVTPYHGDKASFLGWKWSFLIAVRALSKPLYEGFKKIEDNINQDFRKSRSSSGDLELSDQAYTLPGRVETQDNRSSLHVPADWTNITRMETKLVDRDDRLSKGIRNKEV